MARPPDVGRTTKSFVQDTAERAGKSPRTIRQALQTAKNMTPEAKSIIQEAGTKVTKSDALKLSRLPPEQQEAAASKLAAGDIRSVDEYQPAPAEPQNLEQRETSPSAPQASENCYPTIKASVEELKNPDKDRRRTLDTFLMTFSFFLQRFCSGMALVLKTYETELDDDVFVKRLSTVDPEEILRRGRADFSTNKAALRFARVILGKYNSQQRGGRKLPYRFRG